MCRGRRARILLHLHIRVRASSQTGAQLTLSRHYRVGIWHGRVLGVHESLWVRDRFWKGRCSNPWVGRGGRSAVGCNPRVTFDGKVRNLGPCVLKFDSPLPEDHRTHILSTADSPRHHCKLGGGSASISGTSVYRGSKRVG